MIFILGNALFMRILSAMENGKHLRLSFPLSEQGLTDIEEWRRRQADLPNRSEAIRRLIHIGLAASQDGYTVDADGTVRREDG